MATQYKSYIVIANDVQASFAYQIDSTCMNDSFVQELMPAVLCLSPQWVTT